MNFRSRKKKVLVFQILVFAFIFKKKMIWEWKKKFSSFINLFNFYHFKINKNLYFAVVVLLLLSFSLEFDYYLGFI